MPVYNGYRRVLGNAVSLGDGVSLGDDVSLGDGATVGDRGAEPIDLGYCDGYRKTICNVAGIAYIGAGCRWFTLADARRHWAERSDRELTRSLLLAAGEIARLKGWREE